MVRISSRPGHEIPEWRSPIAPRVAGIIGGLLVGTTMALSVQSVPLGLLVGVLFGIVVWAVWRFGVHAVRLRYGVIEWAGRQRPRRPGR